MQGRAASVNAIRNGTANQHYERAVYERYKCRAKSYQDAAIQLLLI